MHNYIHLLPGGRKSRNGEMYYEEFKTEFWKKQGKYYLFPFIYLNFTKYNLKFSNNILETEYDRIHNANLAAQAMLSLSSGENFASRRMEENIRQNVINQGEDELEGGNNQDIWRQGEHEEGFLDFNEEVNNEEENKSESTFSLKNF